MTANELQPTVADAVAKPEAERLVTLECLRDKDGKPVVVRIARVPVDVVARLRGQLPGRVPASGESVPVDFKLAADYARAWVAAAAVEPRFSLAEEPGAIPVDWLGELDLGRLAEAAMVLAGVFAGDAFRQ